MPALATDTFTRANETPLAAPWVKSTNPDATPPEDELRLISNAVTYTTSDAMYRYSGVTWPNDQYVQGAITATGTSADSGMGLSTRISTADNYTGYRTVVNKASSGTVDTNVFVAKVKTVLGAITTAWVDGTVLRMESIGTTHKLYKSGVLIATFTNATLASGQAGISYSSTMTAATLDNWEGGSINTTPILVSPTRFPKFVLREGARQ